MHLECPIICLEKSLVMAETVLMLSLRFLWKQMLEDVFITLQNAMMEGILILPPCCKQQVWPWIMSKQTVSFISIRRTISAARAKCWLQTVIWNLESGSAGSATVCFKSNSHQHIYRCISLQNTQHIERSTEPSSSPEPAHSVITCPTVCVHHYRAFIMSS